MNALQIYDLTENQHHMLPKFTVWSSAPITFCVVPCAHRM